MPIFKESDAMGILQGIFKARDKPKDSLSSSRYSFFFGGTTAGKPVAFVKRKVYSANLNMYHQR